MSARLVVWLFELGAVLLHAGAHQKKIPGKWSVYISSSSDWTKDSDNGLTRNLNMNKKEESAGRRRPTAWAWRRIFGRRRALTNRIASSVKTVKNKIASKRKYKIQIETTQKSGRRHTIAWASHRIFGRRRAPKNKVAILVKSSAIFLFVWVATRIAITRNTQFKPNKNR